ncbi:MAG: glycerol-3-phosphate dehydrogenase [Pseudomonadota bacterium]
MAEATTYDIAIIGGGVNGCGIARDAAGRGLSVYLCEKGDIGGATSSWSTKLFHGGLRYLEYYEFRLVREALIEREALLEAMPHISWPLRFVLPHHKGLRPAWLLRLGLFIYDNLGGRKILPGTKTLDLRRDPAGAPLRDDFKRGFEYSDCWVEDARLVALNARDAADRGASVEVGVRCVRAERAGGVWSIDLETVETGERRTVTARGLVNAAGPWVDAVINGALRRNDKAHTRLVRGSHIVTKRLFDHDRAYIFQNADQRIVFAIPYERDFTLIGTTDVDHDASPSEAACSPEEADYMRRAASEYFAKPIAADDIVWTYSGVRPLYDDGTKSATAATRDYVLDVSDEDGRAPLLNIFGGKITTYRRLAEAVLKKLAPYYPEATDAWTAGVPLPGGDFPVDGFAAQVDALLVKRPFLERQHAERLVRAYGALAIDATGGATDEAGLGRRFGYNLYEAEVRYLMAREWARGAADVLWRRSKLGLRVTADEAAALDAWMADARRAFAAAAE